MADQAEDAPLCKVVARYGKTIHSRCAERGKIFSILQQGDTLKGNAYAHAFLLGPEIEEGPLDEITKEFQYVVNSFPAPAREVSKQAVLCIASNLHRSVSLEFNEAVESAIRGYENGFQKIHLKKPKFERNDILISAYGIEIAEILDGLAESVLNGSQVEALGTIADVIRNCGVPIAESVKAEILKPSTLSFLLQLARVPWGRGCSAFTVSRELSSFEAMIHARTMDGDVVDSWRKHPVIFMVEEPGERFLPYVATATAGVFFPGGVSGFNQNGISVSIHEMKTKSFRLFDQERKAAIAPFALQRILREARSVDDAIALLRDIKHIAAWTVLVSDAKRNEVASVEFSSSRLRVARRCAGDASVSDQCSVGSSSVAQSNHFLHPDMADQAFTVTFGKTLDSWSRFATLENHLRKVAEAKFLRTTNADTPPGFGLCRPTQGGDSSKGVGLDWVICNLAGHSWAGGEFTSFGRNVAKSYTAMATIAIPWASAQVDPQMWFTLGDFNPVLHGHFVGFQVDFANHKLVPLHSRIVDYGMPSWRNSLSEFVAAKAAYRHKNIEHAIVRLQAAREYALKDGVKELGYSYMLGRMYLERGNYSAADSEFRQLWESNKIAESYQRALVAMFWLWTDAASSSQSLTLKEKQDLVSEARTIFLRHFRDLDHRDLRKKIGALDQLARGRVPDKLPAADFTTLE